MRVLTYNIAGRRGRRRPDYLQRIADLVREIHADVVGLQEVVHHPGEPAPEEVLSQLTGMHAAYVPAHRAAGHALGNAILSREPIHGAHSTALPHTWPERRTLLEAGTTVGGIPVTLFCTHLIHMAGAAARFRRAQVSAIVRRMSGCMGPHVLVGDLNAGPLARELHPIRQMSPGRDHLRGLRSWPARRPVVLYDHIWPGPGWDVERLEILGPHLSDHRPLFAQLGWRRGHPER